MNVAEVLSKDRILLGLSAKTRDEAISKMVDTLYDGGVLTDKKAFTDDVLARESVCATGIGNGIAIPHGKSANVKETAVIVARLEDAVEWESVDDEPVKFVVLLAVNENDKGSSHVRLLSQMARKLASAETCRRLLDVKDAQEVVSIFSEE